MMGQNRSHAVMAQRQGEMFAEEHEDFPGQSKLDDFPTPPWGTRAFIRTMRRRGIMIGGRCWDPGANRGFMVRPLQEAFETVRASDVFDYGFGYGVEDFLLEKTRHQCDWLVTNPPFVIAEDFWVKAMSVATIGVAFLTRPGFLEGTGRYERIYSRRRPNLILQYAERLPMVKGRCEKMAGTATQYLWSIWFQNDVAMSTEFDWIEPCREVMEREDDYDVYMEQWRRHLATLNEIEDKKNEDEDGGEAMARGKDSGADRDVEGERPHRGHPAAAEDGRREGEGQDPSPEGSGSAQGT